jgi:hypothetical protein
MRTLPVPTDRKTSDRDLSARGEEETLVADRRGALTPSQFVEEKLVGMLKSSPLPVSHVQRLTKPGPR